MKFVYFPQLDKVLSLVISLWVIYNAISTLISSFKIMQQAIPDNARLDEIKLDLKTIPGITEVHDLHIWNLDESQLIPSLQIVLEPDLDYWDKRRCKIPF